MSEPRTEHPTTEDLAAFADGRLADPGRIEAHLDLCPDCTTVIVSARKIELLCSQALLPNLTSADKAGRKEKLRQIATRAQAGQSGQVGAARKDAKLPSTPSGGFFMALGGMAEGIGLGGLSSEPAPALAGSDNSSAPDTTHPLAQDEHPLHETGREHDSSEFHHPHELPGHKPASKEETTPSSNQDVLDFLQRAQHLLGSDSPDAYAPENTPDNHSSDSATVHHTLPDDDAHGTDPFHADVDHADWGGQADDQSVDHLHTDDSHDDGDTSDNSHNDSGPHHD